MKIKQIMNRPANPIDPTASVADPTRKIREEDVGCLLVGGDNTGSGVSYDEQRYRRRVLANLR